MGTFNSWGATRRTEPDPIGDEGLKGMRHGAFVSVFGPCGEGHTMQPG